MKINLEIIVFANELLVVIQTRQAPNALLPLWLKVWWSVKSLRQVLTLSAP